MNYLLALALLVCALPSVSAQCFQKLPTPGMEQCQDHVDNTWHDMGSTWINSKCMRCTCSDCCAAYSTPTSYPEDCEAVFDQKACKYNVHKKNDPSVSCPVHGAVGK
ncbi:beta-microseminoprotein-like isoform X2 [Thalassophryne amazonica]|uniref:beta-microseminoprotein-like isoform X2 n=1 Tax=Thalassophryne amazonica TaxID=390379 RepID=UPI001471DD44|nr:beta-microseminoprotein-like isoform X2 [Thalassophryne amazonica]